MAKSHAERRDARHVRRLVFVHEQGVPEAIVVDFAIDVNSDHFIAVTEAGEIVGSARGYGCEGSLYKVERVAVLRPWRGRGVGEKLMGCIENVARKQAFRRTWLNAQLGALRFYLGVGYYPIGNPFLHENIVHIGMQKRLAY